MQFSKVLITTLAASTAVSASPVAAHPATPLVKKNDAVGVVLLDVEDLLGTVVKDVAHLLADAGLNVTSVLDPILLPLGLKKRDGTALEIREEAALETRDLSAILSDVDGLVSDILKGVGKISSDLLGL